MDMQLEVTCPHCGFVFNVLDPDEGGRDDDVICPNCEQFFYPGGDEES